MQICSQRGKRCSVTISTHGNSTAAPSLAARGHCSLASLVVHSSISMMPSFVSITRRLVAMRSMSVTRRQFGYCLGEPTPLSTRGTFIRTYITIMHSLWPVRRAQRLQPLATLYIPARVLTKWARLLCRLSPCSTANRAASSATVGDALAAGSRFTLATPHASALLPGSNYARPSVLLLGVSPSEAFLRREHSLSMRQCACVPANPSRSLASGTAARLTVR